MAEWQIVKAWPCKYTGSDFNGTASEVKIELIKFAYEGLTRLGA